MPTKYCPHIPTPKQLAAHVMQDTQELFFGGAAGGGKTDWLLREALMYVDVPTYSGILFRESFPNLSHEPDGLMPRLESWLRGTDARWAGSTRTWHFPSGATLTFGYMYKPDDHHRYAGPSYQFIGYDEVTEIRARSYQFMFSRLRRNTKQQVPLRIRATSNPGGRSHSYFRDRFQLDKSWTERNLILPPTRRYVPSSITDNPYLDQVEYEKTLQELSPVDRERLLKGDWRVTEEGGVFHRSWFPVTTQKPSKSNVRSVRYWDLAATPPSASDPDPDYTVGLRMDWDDEGRFWVTDVVRIQNTPLQVELKVKEVAAQDGEAVHIVIEQEPGASGVGTIDHYQRDVLPGYAVYADRTRDTKVARAGAVASASEAGNVYLLRGPWNEAFLDEVTMFGSRFDGHDDQVDAFSGAHRYLTRRYRLTGPLMV